MPILSGEHKSQSVSDQTYLFLDDNFFIIINPAMHELWHLCPKYYNPDKGRRVQGGKCRMCDKVPSTTVITQYELLRSW